jgi:hypothetical protein
MRLASGNRTFASAGGHQSFLLTVLLLRRKLYFHVSKKEYSISATNKHCAFRKQSVSKPAERKAPKRYG